MFKLLTLMALSFICTQVSLAGGVLIGNGGNIIRCSNHSDFQTLDLVIARGSMGKHVDTEPVQNLNASFKRIEKIIELNLPFALESFREFTRSIKNKNKSDVFIWKNRFNGVDTVKDEIPPIPFRCRNNYESIEIIQTIVKYQVKNKETNLDQYIFEYDPEALKLIESRPLQISFMYVHEWLWVLTKDVKLNRKINYFLHTSLINELNGEEIKATLNKLGFFYPIL